MAIMIRQTVSAEKKSFGQTMAYIFGIVISINILIELTNLLPVKYATVSSILVIIGCAIVCSHVINRKIAKYTYVLLEKELIFYKEIGTREKKVLNIKIQDIEDIKPVKKVHKGKGCSKVHCLTSKLRGKGVYIGHYRVGEKLHGFIFQPNQDLYRELMKDIPS
ncbi:MAG: hypothetical protein JJT76_11765 [Clostridiaceae bacterium]|nr:hypothetical protein [Clostridiaceae bacterium]